MANEMETSMSSVIYPVVVAAEPRQIRSGSILSTAGNDGQVLGTSTASDDDDCRSDYSLRSRGNNKEPLKTILKSMKSPKPKKSKRLTERRERLIKIFLKTVINVPDIYGKVGTRAWTNELISSLNERIKRQRTTPYDVRVWFNETECFKELLDQIPDWKNYSWLRSGYFHASTPSPTSMSLPNPPSSFDTGFGSLDSSMDENPAIIDQDMKKAADAGQSGSRARDEDLRSVLRQQPQLFGLPNASHFRNTETTEQQSPVNEGNSMVDSDADDELDDDDLDKKFATLFTVDRHFPSEDNYSEQGEYNDISMNFPQSYNTEIEIPWNETELAGGGSNFKQHEKMEPPQDTKDIPELMKLNLANYQPPPMGTNLPDGQPSIELRRVDQLLSNYTNVLLELVENLRNQSYYGLENFSNWEVCYNALTIIQLTSGQRN